MKLVFPSSAISEEASPNLRRFSKHVGSHKEFCGLVIFLCRLSRRLSGDGAGLTPNSIAGTHRYAGVDLRFAFAQKKAQRLLSPHFVGAIQQMQHKQRQKSVGQEK